MSYTFTSNRFCGGRQLLTLLPLLCLALLAWPSQAQVAASCPDGLVHYFGLDEQSSGTYTDYASPATAECISCPTPAEGLFAGAQSFSGGKNGININTIENFEWGPNSHFTIELWVRVGASSSENQVLIGRDAKDSDMIWWLGIGTDGSPRFEMYDRNKGGFAIVNESIKINDGKWHHLAVVREGRVRLSKLYVDGYTVGNYEFDYEANFESASPVNIGYLDLNNGYGFKGLLDEVMVYNRALSETEMRARYNRGAGNYCGPEGVKPKIMSEAVTHGVVGQEYTYDVQAVGKAAPTFSVSGPAGIAINANTGELKWVPTAYGSYKITVTATNNLGSDRQEFTINVKKGTDEKVGMLHHWMLHEISGTRYHDYYTPYLATASESTKPKPTNGVVSGGQEFDGRDDGLDVLESYNFDWERDENFSIEVWIRSEGSTAGNRVLIGREAKDSNMQWWLGLDGEGRAGFQLIDITFDLNYTGNGGPRLNDGKWHQLVAVRNGSAGFTQVYVDGEKVAETNYRYREGFASRTPVNIGYLTSGNGYHYEGVLDEVKLFGRALPAAEIKERYEAVYDAITELLRFEGKYNGGSVLLTWETAAEAGLARFEVERAASPDEAFEKIGEVAAAGNSNSLQAYSFTDTEPLQEKGYYRLKIVKEDGKYTYSNIVMVENRGPSATYFKVYPNPIAEGEVTGELSNLPPGERVRFFVSDLRGKRLLEQELEVDALGQLQVKVQVGEEFRSGIYSLTVVSSKRIISRKLVVAR